MQSYDDIQRHTKYVKELKQSGEYNCIIREYKHATRVCVYDRMKNVLNKDIRKDGKTLENYEYIGLLTDEAKYKYELSRDKNSKQISFEDVNDNRTCGIDNDIDTHTRTSRVDSIKRSKDRLLDICYNNDFTLFVTLTIDDTVLDSRSKEDILHELYKWLKSTVKTYGLKAVLVPEYHKDGKRIHFHGFMSTDRPLKLERAYSKKTGKPLFTKGNHRPIFNIPRWKYGFTTAMPIDENYIRTVRYISKYITKDTEKIFGKRYFSCGKLNRDPITTHYEIVDYDAVELREYNIPNTNRKVKYDIKFEEKIDNPAYNIDGSIK